MKLLTQTTDYIETVNIALNLNESYDKPVMIHYRNYGFMDIPTNLFKIIKCVNSEPVNLGIK